MVLGASSFAMVIGLVVGVAIGKVTEYYTSEKKRHGEANIAEAVETGPATNIIQRPRHRHAVDGTSR
jgi:Na+/H+-translocating membrane pyrophosphatase